MNRTDLPAAATLNAELDAVEQEIASLDATTDHLVTLRIRIGGASSVPTPSRPDRDVIKVLGRPASEGATRDLYDQAVTEHRATLESRAAAIRTQLGQMGVEMGD